MGRAYSNMQYTREGESARDKLPYYLHQSLPYSIASFDLQKLYPVTRILMQGLPSWLNTKLFSSL